GNMIHYTAKGNIAHNFLRLKEGSIYSIRNFAVHPNKDDFRVVKHAAFMLEFDGSTTICKASVSDGGLGDVLIKKKIKHARMCAVVFDFNVGQTLNSSIRRAVINGRSMSDESIQLYGVDKKGSVVKASRQLCRLTSPTQGGTLENVLIWAKEPIRRCMDDGTTYPVVVVNAKKELPVNLESGFAKHATRQLITPVIRYKLELGVADDTTHVVVVLFDEPTTELLKCSVESLLASVDESIDEDSNLPTAITNLVGTTHRV
ncbi:ATP-dependent DNA helicase PIF1-like protein, partial [Tanacetum coccineum]